MKLLHDTIGFTRWLSSVRTKIQGGIYYTPYQDLERQKTSFADWAKGKPYYNELAPFFERLCPRTPQTDREVQFLVDVLKTHDPQARTLLDVACGTGRHARLLSERGYDVTGIDASPSLLKEARRRDGKTQYKQGDMRRFNAGKTFDCIICLWDAYPYLSQPGDLDAFLDCCYRHLHPGGVLILESRNYTRPCNTLDRKEFHVEEYDIEVFSWRRTILCDNIHECIFTFFIHDRVLDENIVILDQELNRTYDVATVHACLERNHLALLTTSGDFRLDAPFSETASTFQIIISKKEHKKAS